MLYTDEMRQVVRETFGDKTADKIKIRRKNSSRWYRFWMKLWPQLRRSSAFANGNTIWVNDNFPYASKEQTMDLVVHEATHIDQGRRLPVIHDVLYGIGSPWLLLMIGLPFLEFWFWGFGLMLLSLALSATGLIFPHARAWIEYEAFLNGGAISYRFYSVRGRRWIEKRMEKSFCGSFYWWMGGLWGKKIAKRLVDKMELMSRSATRT